MVLRKIGCTLILIVIAGCGGSVSSEDYGSRPIFHDPNETRISGWTGIDARSLVPDDRVGYIALAPDRGQSRIWVEDFGLKFGPSAGNGQLTADVGPGSYFVLLGECSSPYPGQLGPQGPFGLVIPSGLYEAEVVNGSHAVPVRSKNVELFDDSSGGLDCTGSPGTGPSALPSPI